MSPSISDSPAPASTQHPQVRICDQLAVAVLTIATAGALLTFRDFGLGWDDYSHSQYGELLLDFYASGFADRRALSFVNLYQYGGGFDLLATLAAKILPFTVFETRRLMGASIGLLGLYVTWRTARRLGGPTAGLAALVLLATCPLFVGHQFVNAKDGPFAVAMAILLLGLVRSVEDYPRPSYATIALVGIGFGLSIGSRIMGGFGLFSALGALTLLVAADSYRNGLRPAGARLAQFFLALLPAMALAYAVMGLVWPWSVLNPLNPLRAVEYFAHFFEVPWRELFGGELILVPDMPRSYVPTLLALNLPELFFILGIGGTAAAVVSAFWQTHHPPHQRAALLLVMLAAILPIAIAILVRPAMYNGIRHFVFVLPPLAIIGGLAAAQLLEAGRRRGTVAVTTVAIVFLAGIASPMVEMARLHPYAYAYFNRFAGGVQGARDNYMLDYWALSFKQASQELAAKLAELGLVRPDDGYWRIAVCGPHPSPQVELGSDYSITWDPQGADFAMMLGEFYCTKFDAPILVEITRAGVVFARVYDIRGRSYQSLLIAPRS